jgi:predicted chitinase
MLSESDLRQIMPRIPQDKFEIYLLILNKVMEDFQINTPLRAAAFLAQLAHESGQLRFMEEIWGPTAAQKRYEPPSDLATRLGNTEPGDGKRFKGRGPIQITGRANYKRYGDLLGVDLIRNPDLAATPSIAFQIAATYWTTNRLNELADAGDFTTITRRINGGLNGLQDRLKFYDIAKNVLGAGDEPGDFVASNTRGALSRGGVPGASSRSFAQPEQDSSPLPPPVLPRGYEEIEEDAHSTTASTATAPKRESKKKSAGASSKVAKKPISRKSVIQGVKKVSKKPAKKTTKKIAQKVTAKAVKSPTKKAAKKVMKKVAKKPASKAAKKSTAKSAKKGAIRIIIVKASSKPAKKSR